MKIRLVLINQISFFLIGKNNNGKSTFLHAYDFFVSPKKRATIEDFSDFNTTEKIEIEGIFISEPDDSKDKDLSKGEPSWIENWVDKNNRISIKKTWSNINEEGKKQTYSPKEGQYIEGGFGGFDTLLKKYAPSAIMINAVTSSEDLEKLINDIITKNHIKKLETEYSEDYDNIITSLENLKGKISNAEDITKINSDMTNFFKKTFPEYSLKIAPIQDSGVDITKTLKSTHGIKVGKSDNNKSQNSAENIVSDYNDENFHSLDKNGHGIMRQAFFSFLSTYGAEIKKEEKEYLILFEEPELYLHPSAIFSLRDQLYELAENSPYQIMCATHSPLMIDTSKTHSSLIRLEKERQNSITKTRQVDFDLYTSEEKDYLQMMNRFNPHICESFFADEVILVEGDTEAIIYRELIKKFYSDYREVFVLNTGSKSNMVFYQKILTHFGIKHVVVHDVDSKTVKINKGKETEREQTNAMWTYNQKIWDQIVTSNTEIKGISRRFVHNRNFEDAHDYKYDFKKGKPLSAFEFAKQIERDSKIPSIRFLDDFFGEGIINFSPEDIEEIIREKDTEE